MGNPLARLQPLFNKEVDAYAAEHPDPEVKELLLHGLNTVAAQVGRYAARRADAEQRHSREGR